MIIQVFLKTFWINQHIELAFIYFIENLCKIRNLKIYLFTRIYSIANKISVLFMIFFYIFKNIFQPQITGR